MLYINKIFYIFEKKYCIQNIKNKKSKYHINNNYKNNSKVSVNSVSGVNVLSLYENVAMQNKCIILL